MQSVSQSVIRDLGHKIRSILVRTWLPLIANDFIAYELINHICYFSEHQWVFTIKIKRYQLTERAIRNGTFTNSIQNICLIYKVRSAQNILESNLQNPRHRAC